MTNTGTAAVGPSSSTACRFWATVAAMVLSPGVMRIAPTGQVHESGSQFSWLMSW